MKVIAFGQHHHVDAAELEREAGIAIKTLPGQEKVAACIEERCALVGGVVTEPGRQLVPVQALADALEARLQWSADRQTVRLHFPDPAQSPREIAGSLGVGRLAPDFRLPRLDGTSISLADLRGKRVLINSWASW